MDDLIIKTKRYLEETLDVKAEISSTDTLAKLPYFYTELYRLYYLILNGVSYLLCEGREILTAKQVRIQLSELENRTGKRAIYLNAEITANLRRTLVENRVSFIIPNSQIYLPVLGIAFKEKYRVSSANRNSYSPLAQVIIIRTLVNRDYDPITATAYSAHLPYTVMSISRAFNELIAQNLIKKEDGWRRKPIRWVYQGMDLWERAKPMLFNPLRRTMWIHASYRVPYCIAGVSALAQYSNINEDQHTTYATKLSHSTKEKDLGISCEFDDKMNELQLWIYDPKLITNVECVDQFSLYLSLKDSTDERIQISLDKMMDGIQW